MNNYKWKPIVITAKKGCAIAMNYKKEYASISAKTNILASLEALKAVLNKIPADKDVLLEEPRLVILWAKSPIVGFATGSYIEYLRTNHTVSGIPFTNEEMTLIRDIALLLAQRSLNVSICTDKFISNNNFRSIIDAAWKAVNYCISTQGHNEMPQNDTRVIEYPHDDANEAYRGSESVDDKKHRLYQSLQRVNNTRKIKNNSFCGEDSALVTDISSAENKNFLDSYNSCEKSNSISQSKKAQFSAPKPSYYSTWELLCDSRWKQTGQRTNEMSEKITSKMRTIDCVSRLYDSWRKTYSSV